MTKNTNPVDDVNAGAEAETASAGTATGSQQAEVGAGYRSAGAEVTSDIGQAEAYITNMKRLVASELDFDSALRSVALQSIQGAVARDNLVQNNALTLSNRVNNLSVDHDSRIRAFQEGEISRTVRHSDLAIDRQWNIDEVAALVAKTPVFQDAIAGAVAAAVAATVGAQNG